MREGGLCRQVMIETYSVISVHPHSCAVHVFYTRRLAPAQHMRHIRKHRHTYSQWHLLRYVRIKVVYTRDIPTTKTVIQHCKQSHDYITEQIQASWLRYQYGTTYTKAKNKPCIIQHQLDLPGRCLRQHRHARVTCQVSNSLKAV
jgi:hypothetical protein